MVVPRGDQDPRPIAGYSLLISVYSGVVAAIVVALRRSGRRFRRVGPFELVLYALATQRLARLVTKDAVTAPLRKPFTRFTGEAGLGEVNEEVVGHGLRKAVGEVLPCPFCAGQWVATFLFAGALAAPDEAAAGASTLAIAQLADVAQLGYAKLRGVTS